MYVCGMTVYDLCHVGHARMMMAFDVVYRWLLTLGYEVNFVRNITDIDDKIIRRALERGVPIRELTDEMIAAMHEDLAQLGVLPPAHEPRATEYVPQMIDLIARLIDKGLAYQDASGDVNFAVRKFDGYGRMSGRSLDDLRAGERVAVGDDKRDPLDFVLWKSAKADEPSDARWDSAFGPGRPGWHIECSAMACALLGETVDIHGGGLDLQFPHHENEIAQSEGASGKPMARYWLHNGFLNIDDTKMSKSLGNFFTLRDVLQRFDGETLRFFMLRTHYRSPFNFSETNVEDARAGLRRLYTALGSVGDMPATEVDWTLPQAAAFQAAMNDDFNTPAALAILFELASEVNRGADANAASLLKSLGATLGLLSQDGRNYLQSGAGLAETEIERLIGERTTAKAERRFADADRLRLQLAEQGVQLKDSPNGTQWVRA